MRAAEAFILVGNSLSLDFVNTQSMREGTKIDSLRSDADLMKWARAAGLEVSAGRSRKPHAELDPEIRRLRAAMRRLFEAYIDGRTPSQSDLLRLNALLSKPEPGPALIHRGGRFIREPRAIRDAHGVLARVAEDAARLLTAAERPALRRCAGERCVLLFLDRSRSNVRRWCSMEVCGNRAKVAAHYQRTHG